MDSRKQWKVIHTWLDRQYITYALVGMLLAAMGERFHALTALCVAIFCLLLMPGCWLCIRLPDFLRERRAARMPMWLRDRNDL